ncbi:hypothetical protein MXB_879 [Myxobolus squamalis]|nr:hypothetical protein MXB_879 [Myxobolus squamalis]
MFNKLSGVQKKVIGEGTHIRIPFIQDPYRFDIRTRPRSVPTITGTKGVHVPFINIDLQNVSITIRVLFRPKVSELCTIFKTLGPDYDERILPSITAEVLKSVVTQLSFSKEFMTAVEMKQVAQQEAERARFLVEKAEHEKNAVVLSSEGDSRF